MKALVSIFVFAVSIFSLNAQGVFVVQNASNTSSYLTLGAAVGAAADGDFIYVPGGDYSVSNLVINKQLHIIGAGHYPDSTKATGRSVISGTIYFHKGADFSVLQGLYLKDGIVNGTNCTDGSSSNLLFSRCNIGTITFGDIGSCSTKNNLVRECVIRSTFNVGNTQGNVVENCVLNGILYGVMSNFLMKNCIFTYRPDHYILNVVNSGTFENCIFSQAKTDFMYSNAGTLSTFRNCIFGSSTLTTDVNYNFQNCAAYGENIKELFVNLPEYNFDYSYDFHLSENSIAKGFGTNGTDCGIYGGENPYKEGAVPMNPHIQMITVPATTDNAGKLNITVKVKAQNN